MPGTETSPIFGLTIWAGPQSAPWEVENAVQRAFEALLRGSVADRDLTAPPGACTDGAAYLIASPSTGAWAGEEGKLAVAVGTNAANGWIFLPVENEGTLLFVEDEAVMIQYQAAAWQPLVVAKTYTIATLPSAAHAGQIIYISDEAGGAVLAFADGANWRRVTDRAVAS